MAHKSNVIVEIESVYSSNVCLCVAFDRLTEQTMAVSVKVYYGK